MIEQGRFPTPAVVAIRAQRDPTRFSKLSAMNVLVAILTFSWSRMEIHMDELGFHIERLVAVYAGYCPVRACQWKFGLGMIELIEFLPCLGGMASLAPAGLSVDHTLHAFAELPLMRVFVTGRAGQVLKMIERRSLGLGGCIGRDLMTLEAGHRQMGSGQQKPRLFMSCQPKCRRFIAIQRVALLAAIQVRRCRELSLMFISMAVEAALKFEREDRFFSFRNVALCAFQ